MPKGLNQSSSERHEVVLPMYSVYTDEFDRECSAKELYVEKLGSTKRKHAVLDQSNKSKEKLIFMAKSYKENSLAVYGYIPPIVFVTDNSGSLRWQPASYLEWLLIEISEAFEHVWIPFEVLWYTTRTWKGGESRKKWLRNGRLRGENNEGPWRLCDIQYTIFKGFWEKFSNIKEFYGLLAVEWYLKDNLDGEALIWAYERINKRAEEKKHIIHLSDGAPVDDSTLSVNGGDFLFEHLHSVLTELQKDSNTKIHQGFIYDQYEGKTQGLPYDSHSLLKPSWNALDDFTDQLFPAIMEMGMDEIIENRKKALSEILGEEISLLGDEDLLFITRNFNPEILSILKEFWYSGIDILLNIKSPIENIDEGIFRMNLWIIKHSWKKFWDQFGRLLPIITHYSLHAYLEVVVNDSDNIDTIIATLKNSDKYIQATQWKQWQKKFLEKYSSLIEENRLNIDILSFLADGNHISDEDVGDLYIILQFWNFETVQVLLWDCNISYGEIKKDKSTLEYHDAKKLWDNMKLLRDKWITHTSQLELVQFSMWVNSLMLQAAIQYGFDSYKSLKKIKNILKADYTAESEKELIKKIIEQKEKSYFTWNMIIRAPFITFMWTVGFSNLTYAEGMMVFLESFNNIWWFDLAAFYFFYLSWKGWIKRFKNIKTNTQSKTWDSIKLRGSYKKFRIVMDKIIASKYHNIRANMIKELEETYTEIQWITSSDVQKMIGVDTDRVTLQYNVVRVQYMLKLLPDISFLQNKDAAQELSKYLKIIVDLGPRYVQDNWYNFNFFLQQKSKLQWQFWADFWESQEWNEKSIMTPEVRAAYKILWVKKSATEEEVNSAYKKLVRDNHPDRQWWDDTRMLEINPAKDVIDTYRWWN